MFVAIIGDIVNSRGLEKREETQERIKEILGEINHNYSDEIAADFTITLGDEFQGLLRGGGCVFEIIECIRRMAYPVRFRIGVGIGTMSTAINRDAAIGADGPAFYNARDAIVEVAKMSSKHEQPYRDILICMTSDGAELALINSAVGLASFIESQWSVKQREVMNLLLEHKDLSQKDIAAKLELSPSSVHRRLQISGFGTYSDTMTKAQVALNQILEVASYE